MKNFTISITVLGVLLAAMWPAYARDTKHILPIAAAMATKDAEEKLEGSVKFFFWEAGISEGCDKVRH